MVKKFISNVLAFLGYAIIKIHKKKLINTKRKIKVGNYNLALPSSNPLIYTYQTNSNHSSEIGRLVGVLAKKYPGLYCIDVGANVGDTMLLVKTVNKTIKIICIEGDQTSFSYLKENAAQVDNVFLFNSYLGESNSTMNVAIEKAGWNNTIKLGVEGGKKVDFITLDNLIYNQFDKDSLIKFIKIDTEGFDTIILRGALKIIKEKKPVIYFEYNRENMDAIKEDGLSTVLKMLEYDYSKILFFDDRGRYVLHTDLANIDLIKELHSYVDGKGLITYYNICLISKEDEDLCPGIIKDEISFYTN